MDAPAKKRRTRIQTEKRELILEAALEVFSAHGFRGSTIDQIAEAAGMSKPNLLYYFRRKEDIHEALIERLLKTWLQPLRELDEAGDPFTELRSYIRRKLEMARDYPRESRLFANEILQGAPRIMPLLEGELKTLVEEKAAI
ncbi:MAG: TetR family transcriptional regulator C-terminal domain-containing protein, partial [Rhizobiaceae bacterium]